MMPSTGSLRISLPRSIVIIISWRRGPNTTFFVWRDHPITGTMMGDETLAPDWVEATNLIGEMSGRAITESLTGSAAVVK